MKSIEKNIEEPIDVVITWVDGNDESHRKLLQHYIQEEGLLKSPNVDSRRFVPSDEIKYCLLSIFKFAPFVRNVFIVTNGQKPDVASEIKKYFPDRLSSIKYISHEEIFAGYEEYLPIFNSRGVETMLWRIPGLSERFVYFNDDFFLVKNVDAQDWVKNDKLVLRGKWHMIPIGRIIWYNFFVPKRKKRASYHMGQWNAAQKAGFRFRYFVFEHIPCPISKTVMKDFYTNNPQLIIDNIKSRFRRPEQFNPTSLSCHLNLLQGKAVVRENSDLSYLQPYNRAKDYVDKKIEHCSRTKSIKFMCVQDLSISSEEIRNKVYTWFKSILGLTSN